MFEVRVDDLTGDATRRLLALHLAEAHINSPPGSVYALDLSGLKAPGVTIWSVHEDDEVLGIGALKELGAGGGEVKSMRTHPDHLRRGVAAETHRGRGKGTRLDAIEPRNRKRPSFRAGADTLSEARLCGRRSILRLSAERLQPVPPPAAVNGEGLLWVEGL